MANSDAMTLLENIATIVNKDPLDIIIDGLKQGSTDVDGEISAND